MKTNWSEEPKWERVWDTTSLSTPELQKAFFTLLDRMDLELYVKRWGDSTGKDPEFLLEKYDQGN